MEDGMEGKTRGRVKGKLPLRLMAAALFIIIAVVVSTWWLIETSQTASGESVYNVSEFYLKELSEQTSRLMQANLNEWERELHAAMNGLGEEELKDFNSLQDYIAKVEGDNLALTQNTITVISSFLTHRISPFKKESQTCKVIIPQI